MDWDTASTLEQAQYQERTCRACCQRKRLSANHCNCTALTAGTLAATGIMMTPM